MESPVDTNLKKNFVSIRIHPSEPTEQQHEIINSLARELRNPVTILKSNIQLLKKFCIKTEDLFIHDSFFLCECAVNDILRFINCLGFLSDSYHGVLKSKKTRFDLNLFLKQGLEEIKSLNFDLSRIHLRLKVQNLFIVTDKNLLQKIVFNLVINALKFSYLAVDLIITESNQRLNIVVRDYGIGIPPTELKEVFKPFVRGGNANMIPGAGLGLSTISRAIMCLGGTLDVKSIPGKETEFNVTIPLESFPGSKTRPRRAISLNRNRSY